MTVRDISMDLFTDLTPIGRGGFGLVYTATYKQDGMTYAVKKVSKARMLLKKYTALVMRERGHMLKLAHPFLVNLHYTF